MIVIDINLIFFKLSSSLALQITEALSFLHYSGQVIHKNVCPSSILVTKKGTWKLAGFEFIGKVYR
jgi:serine/threonine protein kinase